MSKAGGRETIYLLSEFNNENRKAQTILHHDHYGFRCYIDDQLVETVMCPGHSESFAEDGAENFVMKWGKWSE